MTIIFMFKILSSGVWIQSKEIKGLRILIVFSYYAILGIGGLTSIVSSRNLQGFSNAHNIYFLCERNGIGAECDRSGFESYTTDLGLMTVGSILLHIYPAVNHVYVIHIADLKNLKQRCAPCCKYEGCCC